MIARSDDEACPDDAGSPPEYLPARMVNEFVYCPRLFYLMHVEGQFAQSIDTIDGQIVHRRVDSGNGALAAAVPIREMLAGESFLPAADQPAEEAVPEPTAKKKTKRQKHLQPPTLFGEPEPTSLDTDDRSDAVTRESKPDVSKPQDASLSDEPPKTIHARSVTLSSDRLGVIAKLDLAEARGNHVTPVDYKRGQPKRNADGTPGAWDPERVQLALQALLLRDNGYDCDTGVLYFNLTRQRVTVPIDAELIAMTEAAVASARVVHHSARIPAPLVDSPKCARCSLVEICLPDETRRLMKRSSKAQGEAQSEIRPMITARDPRRPLYFNTQGMHVGKQGEVLRAKKDGKVLQEVRLNEIHQINLFGNIQISSQAVQAMLVKEIPLLYFTQRGYFYGIAGGLGAKNITVRREQFRRADDREFCLRLAKSLVDGKIRNQRTLLMRNHREPTAVSLREMKRLAGRTERADSLATLLGIEGMAARIYFQNFSGLLKVDASVEIAPGSGLCEKRSAFDFRGRNRRPPRDPVNALLSLAYSLLTKDCLVAATSVGLDPYLGFYHQVKPGKPALALDVMEPFRPLIADSAVLSAINTKMVTPDHFIVAGKSVVLSDTGRKHFLMAYEQRMDQLVTHPLFDYRVSYRRLLEIQTRLLARLLTGEIETYPVFQTR